MDTIQIRGLTLWRPWPQAFLFSERPGLPAPKRVENRPWWPKWATAPMRDGVALGATGEHALWLALHAGQHVDTKSTCALLRHRGVELQPGPAGVIVAVCRLARVLDVEWLDSRWSDDLDRHYPWISGPYAWEVDQVTALAAPVPCKGAQGLWTLPPGVLAEVRRQWATATAGAP